ncbi:hypothetical protein GN958_ATG04668 [Phytophthora infestans]|uniref:Uncharacterized protein n=1 Tax=Phytophthora infestans TaxID=4787 RepID=A0A8S9V0U1_PHYIN|nr:hypothetical protein GN958_ATG04668 [Phytophthora infestans]
MLLALVVDGVKLLLALVNTSCRRHLGPDLVASFLTWLELASVLAMLGLIELANMVPGAPGIH